MSESLDLSDYYFNFPTGEQWGEIAKTSPFNEVYPLLENISVHDANTVNTLRGIHKRMSTEKMGFELANRFYAANKTYILLRYYFDQGIPDERRYASPGSAGESVRFFPEFETKHFALKSWFDFYTDIFYFKLFSAWEVIGHILNARFELDLKETRIHFWTAVDALREKNNALHVKLNQILESHAFKAGKSIRHDVTHNFSPHNNGPESTYRPGHVDVGLNRYTSSRQIMESVHALIILFGETIQIVAALNDTVIPEGN